jgi:NACHT-associated inactive Restriction Endonuclease 1
VGRFYKPVERNALESRSVADNKLFYGDNLDVLRRYVRDESVDLIYLDPPFNSRQDYNVLFAEKDGTRSSSQITHLGVEPRRRVRLSGSCRTGGVGVERDAGVRWALGLVNARPVEERRGADRGIDGRLYFHPDTKGKTQQIVFSVKAGQNINVAHVRDLRGVIEREKAAIGVLITMEEPTKPMVKEAAEAGF